jgi:hypothetical protein
MGPPKAGCRGLRVSVPMNRIEGKKKGKKADVRIVIDREGGKGWNPGLEYLRALIKGIRARKRASNTFGDGGADGVSRDIMRAVYRLRDDTRKSADVQRATRSTREFGIEPTHGLFGSEEWWERIADGTLTVHTLRGTIARVYMGSMGDWPEFEMRSDSGELSRWTREANSAELAGSYTVGRRVELDYVLQRHRPAAWDGGAETKVVVEIRVDERAEQSAAADPARDVASPDS